MTDRQRIEIKRITLQSEINALPETRDEAGIAKRQKMIDELNDLGKKLADAIRVEGAANDAAFEGSEDSEPAEIRELAGRAAGEFGTAFDGLVNRRAPEGAFSELQAHYGLPAHMIPLRLLEDRAAITGLTDEPSAPQAITDYVFPRSIAAYMGFAMPTVPYGTPSFPVVTTPATIHSPAAGADAAETTGVIGADALEPGRRQGSLRYRREQAAAFPQLAAGVQAHVQAALVSAIDQLALDATAGLGSITEPGDPGAQTTFDNYIGAFSPDGRYAGALTEINVIVGAKTHEHMRGQYRATTAPNSAYQTLTADGLNIRVASGIPAPSTNDQAAYSVKGPALGSGVIPVWDGVEVLADPFTSSVKGEIVVTIVGMAAVKMLRTDAWTRHRFQLRVAVAEQTPKQYRAGASIFRHGGGG